MKGRLKKLEAKERKVMRKIFDPVEQNCEYTRQHNHELHTHVQNITDTSYKKAEYIYNYMYEYREIDQSDLCLLA